MPSRITLDDVERAREVLRPFLPPTPLRSSYALRPHQGWLKLECWQPTGSFKVRGALHVLATLAPDQTRRGVVAASAGNHALGVAHAASLLKGIRATLFVPVTTPRAKVEKLRTFPVAIEERGATYDEAYAHAVAHAERTGATYVHAFDDERTAAGQGTVGLEILDQLPEVATILVPVGGGGLIAGLAAAVKGRAPGVRVVAVQPDASPALRDSLALGRPLLEYAAAPTLADGLAGGIGEIVFAHRDLVDDVVSVSEGDIAAAVVALLAEDQVVAEGSGAVGPAALLGGRLPAGQGRPVVCVVTGGNIDASVLATLLGSARR
jgi:threonine dehydratase